MKVRGSLIVAVTGGREYSNKSHVWQALSKLRAECWHLTLVQGGCPTGADLLAREWAGHQNVAFVQLLTERPNWYKYGKAAGPIRNRVMLEKHDVELLLAFPGDRGTASCIQAAKELGIEVRYPKPKTCTGREP